MMNNEQRPVTDSSRPPIGRRAVLKTGLASVAAASLSPTNLFAYQPPFGSGSGTEVFGRDDSAGNMQTLTRYEPLSGPRWEIQSPGGGGRFVKPTISPDGNRLYVGTDMNSAFVGDISDPNAASMTMLDSTLHDNMTQGGFFTVSDDPRTVYAGTQSGFSRSDDGGRTFVNLDGPWNQFTWDGNWPVPRLGPSLVVTSPEGTAYAYFADFQHSGRPALFESRDRFATYSRVANFPENHGELRRVMFFRRGQSVWGFQKAVVTSEGSPLNWSNGRPLTNGFELQELSGSEDRLYAAMNSAKEGYVFVSEDLGKSFSVVPMQQHPRIESFAAGATNPNVVYFSAHVAGNPTPSNLGRATVYRSSNGMKSFRPVLFRSRDMREHNIEPRVWTSHAWGWNVIPKGIAVCENDFNIVAVCDATQTYVSRNGGRDWTGIAARQMVGKVTPAGGMPLTTVYEYHIDPHNRDYRYTAMNDFCNWFSYDGNRTWAQYNTGNDVPHNVYSLAIDPEVRGRLWAGVAVEHDLPHWKWFNGESKLRHRGTIAISRDYGQTWNSIDNQASGLPAGNVTGVEIDPLSPPSARRLWATVWQKGLFTSEDGGLRWRPLAATLEGSNRFYKVKRDRVGRLWVMTSLRDGTLSVSEDGGRTFERVFGHESMKLLTGIAVDPTNPEILYVSALSNTPFNDETGGIWRSVDNGMTFQKILAKSCWGVSVHPSDPEVVIGHTYDHGLLVSRVSSGEWRHIDGLPAPSVISVTFDPNEPGAIYAGCFGGGIWKGRLTGSEV